MKVSVIIPCYNHGDYIEEAIKSVENNIGNYLYELIIVDDGSTNELTVSVLDNLIRRGYNVIRQNNQGLAAARNNAIAASSGEYIIPLDSDNKIHKNYLVEAVELLDNNEDIDIIYGKPMFFGDEQGIREIGAFDFTRLIEGNFIDACAIFRRNVWKKVNGFDGTMPAMGNEDWEFWIHSFLQGCKFLYLDKLCFYYRVLPNSMSVSTTRPSFELNKAFIYKKHNYGIISNLSAEIRIGKYLSYYVNNHKIKTIAKLCLGRKL